MAQMLRAWYATVTEQQGGAPDPVAVTHPANWAATSGTCWRRRPAGRRRRRPAAISEPEAAAVYYAAPSGWPTGQRHRRLRPRRRHLRRRGAAQDATAGFEILGTPEGIEHLGGIDFDEAVFAHVARPHGATRRARPRRQPNRCPGGRGPAAARTASRPRRPSRRTPRSSIPVMLPGMRDRGAPHPRRARGHDPARPRRDGRGAAAGTALAGSSAPTRRRAAGGGLVPHPARGRDGRRHPRADRSAVDAHPKHGVALGAALAAEALLRPLGAGGVRRPAARRAVGRAPGRGCCPRRRPTESVAPVEAPAEAFRGRAEATEASGAGGGCAPRSRIPGRSRWTGLAPAPAPDRDRRGRRAVIAAGVAALAVATTRHRVRAECPAATTRPPPMAGRAPSPSPTTTGTGEPKAAVGCRGRTSRSLPTSPSPAPGPETRRSRPTSCPSTWTRDGTVEPLLAEPTIDALPSISPDRETIAYVRRDSKTLPRFRD